MYYAMIDHTNKVLNFVPSTTRIVQVDMDQLPVPDSSVVGKVGELFFDEASDKIVIKYMDRPLTTEEEMAKKQSELESQVLNLMEALAEIHEGGGV